MSLWTRYRALGPRDRWRWQLNAIYALSFAAGILGAWMALGHWGLGG